MLYRLQSGCSVVFPVSCANISCHTKLLRSSKRTNFGRDFQLKSTEYQFFLFFIYTAMSETTRLLQHVERISALHPKNNRLQSPQATSSTAFRCMMCWEHALGESFRSFFVPWSWFVILEYYTFRLFQLEQLNRRIRMQWTLDSVSTLCICRQIFPYTCTRYWQIVQRGLIRTFVRCCMAVQAVW